MHRLSAWLDSGISQLKRKHEGQQQRHNKTRSVKVETTKMNSTNCNSWFNRHTTTRKVAQPPPPTTTPVECTTEWQYCKAPTTTTMQPPVDRNVCRPSNRLERPMESSVRDETTDVSCFVRQETSSMMSRSLEVTGSLQRSRIRTNPWLTTHKQRPAELITTSMDSALTKQTLGAGTAPGVVLDDSVCSSGYGSHDSSPESSVHTPDWQERVATLDKAIVCRARDVDEALGLSASECDSDSMEDSDDEATDSEEDEEQDYVYLEPLSSVNKNLPPKFIAPPPPPLDENSDVLGELNRRVGALRAKSIYLRKVVNKAKQERERRLKEKERCLEQIQQLTRFSFRLKEQFEMKL